MTALSLRLQSLLWLLAFLRRWPYEADEGFQYNFMNIPTFDNADYIITD